MKDDDALLARRMIAMRIEALIRGCGTMSLPALARALDDIRAIAHGHELAAVERLSSLLGSVIRYNGHRQIAYNYLELMLDVCRCADDGPDIASAYLAAASLRGCLPSVRE